MATYKILNCKCESCGQFCIPYDQGKYYGSTLDLDEPEYVYYCRICVDKIIQNYLDTDTFPIIKCWWIRPNYISICKSIRRHHEKFAKSWSWYCKKHWDDIIKYARQNTVNLTGQELF